MNRRTATGLPAPPPLPPGLPVLADLVRLHRYLPSTKRLVLELGRDALEALSARDPGSATVVPRPRVEPGQGLTYRQVEAQVRNGWGMRWRLVEDGEVLGNGDLAVEDGRRVPGS
jgi:hypothetical protein